MTINPRISLQGQYLTDILSIGVYIIKSKGVTIYVGSSYTLLTRAAQSCLKMKGDTLELYPFERIEDAERFENLIYSTEKPTLNRKFPGAGRKRGPSKKHII